MKRIVKICLVTLILCNVNFKDIKAITSNSSLVSYNEGKVINAKCLGQEIVLSDDLQGLMVSSDDSLLLVNSDFKIDTEFPVKDFMVIDDIDQDGIRDVFVYLDSEDNYDDIKIISAKSSKVVYSSKHTYEMFDEKGNKLIKNSKTRSINYSDGIIYYIYDYHLVAFDPVKQEIIFDYEDKDNLWKMVVLKDRIIAGNQLGQIICLDKHGDLLYRNSLVNPYSINIEYIGKQEVNLNVWDLIEINGNIYVTLEDSSLCQIDKQTGNIIKTVVLNENIESVLSKNLQDNSMYSKLAPTGLNDYDFMGYQMQMISQDLLLVSSYFGNMALNQNGSDRKKPGIYLVDLNDMSVKAKFALENYNLQSSNLVTGKYQNQDVIIIPASLNDGKLKVLIYDFNGSLLAQNEILVGETGQENNNIQLKKVSTGYLLQVNDSFSWLLDQQLKVTGNVLESKIANKIVDLDDGTLVTYKKDGKITEIRKIALDESSLMSFSVSSDYLNNGFEAINYIAKQNHILALVNEINNVNQVIASHIIDIDLNSGKINDSKVLLDKGYLDGKYYENYLKGAKIDYFSDLNNDGSQEILVDDYLIDGVTKTFKSYYQPSFEGMTMALETGDINNDGITDLINLGETEMRLYYSKKDGYNISYEKTNIFKTYDKKLLNNAFGKVLGDIDGDGINEIVINGYNDNKCQNYQVINCKDLTMKFALMEQGVLDYGETFSLSENDFNHDGKKDIIFNHGDYLFDVISGQDGSVLFSYTSFESNLYSSDTPVPLDNIVEFKINDDSKIVAINDLDDDGFNEYGYLTYLDSYEHDDYGTFLVIIDGNSLKELKRIRLSKEDYTDNDLVAVKGQNLIIYFDENIQQIYDYQDEQVVAGVKKKIKSAKALTNGRLLLETDDVSLYSFDFQCDFKMTGLNNNEVSNGDLTVKYESNKNGIMSVYDQGELVTMTTENTISFKMLPGDHQLLFSYDDGHGKVTHLQTTIVVEKSGMSRYMIMILMVVILLGSAGLVMGPKYYLIKKAGIKNGKDN